MHEKCDEARLHDRHMENFSEVIGGSLSILLCLPGILVSLQQLWWLMLCADRSPDR